MGNRKFYEQMIKDLCQTEKDKITDEVDVTNLKEYMQVSVSLPQPKTMFKIICKMRRNNRKSMTNSSLNSGLSSVFVLVQ